MLLCIAWLCLSVSSQAQQQTQTISGKVINAETKEGLAGAVVSIPALRIGSSTNADGEYSFKAPVGTHS
ncbi:MAG: carboxypeptidase-like regulatory domain-containing protein [Candidatus Thermochlorobacter sp.]